MSQGDRPRLYGARLLHRRRFLFHYRPGLRDIPLEHVGLSQRFRRLRWNLETGLGQLGERARFSTDGILRVAEWAGDNAGIHRMKRGSRGSADGVSGEDGEGRGD